MSSLHELNWLAFRYISGEMSPEELDLFELRLADDQDAREAVAQSVQLTHALVSLPITDDNTLLSEVAQQQGRSRSFAWATAGVVSAIAAICLSFVIGTRFSENDKPETGGTTASLGQGTQKPSITGTLAEDSIVTVWLDGAAEVISSDSGSNELFSDPEETEDILGTESLSAKEGQFDWVLAALDSESPEKRMSEMMKEEK
jgi:hypothetical protein